MRSSESIGSEAAFVGWLVLAPSCVVRPDCHEFNLQAAFAASRSGKPGPSSKCGCLRITSPTDLFPVPGVEDAVMRLNPASPNLVEIRVQANITVQHRNVNVLFRAD